ncbi:alternate-type signal peptide domain-containing protein [Lysinibacter sp. HNR]|uniref:alternate-type signal peptide domain-containing protein n=1 Tax=Lysinibacter sp. HNR TaxID=3031408 RepID=UPI002435D297|nr:alternate-type signal peptide domain-containing protein [Lysinibacter sp. HNR]WGD37847.1 alternate-type signal peptide domain-containing protein [Lysinibacter sp. HNR]
MKKITKATFSTGAAILLLIGSGGTLAYWSQTSHSAQSDITAGNLQLAAKGTPTWKIKHAAGAESTVADIAKLRIVPGDTLTYTFPAEITAQGKNLRFQVGLADGAVATPTNPTAADTALAGFLKANATFTVDNATALKDINGNDVPNVFEHKVDESKTYATTITASINWPSVGDNNTGKAGKVNLSQFSLTVTQIDGSLY